MRFLVLLLLLVSCAPKSPETPGRVDTPATSTTPPEPDVVSDARPAPEPDSVPDPKPDPASTPAADPEPDPAPDPDRVVSVSAAADGKTLRFQLRAPASGALYLDNCGGAFGWGLERQVKGVWKPVWGAIINECHSAPIEITPGQVIHLMGTIQLDPGKTLPADRYRVALHGLFSLHDQKNHQDNPRVPEKMSVSEPIELGPLSSGQ